LNESLEKRVADLRYKVTHLVVGCEAPEIEGVDHDGKQFRLSEFRGKVVLLPFWGFW
jgi:cytochrome oxidase Cu insertion factor (SCO1/SenC/PrrC family)